ncbi:MAG: type III-A CRISPR-associated protein Cas10/Csm1 [Desulfuromonadales bacterium]|nr:MAG: type III-A CRISPR-associated protein Cas10/Csm1 [Desulfuromonadales bacterium]
MNETEATEYRTVILAGLLHDIGKFLHRRRGRGGGKHPIVSRIFVEDHVRSLGTSCQLDIELLKVLVQRHHEFAKMDSELLVQRMPEGRERALAYIVSSADSASSGERGKDDRSLIYFKKARLNSILSRISIGKGDTDKSKWKYHEMNFLAPDKTFPVEGDGRSVPIAYDPLIEGFYEQIGKLKPDNFDRLLSGYLSLLREFLWCVPSDTQQQYREISLFDHLSTTSAIAACLYRFHCGPQDEGTTNLDENDVKNIKTEKFRLVAGDLSGIQNFIFEIGSTNPKKLSTVLRGRSYYLSLLTELAALKILRRLDLPITCRIMNAAGRFVLLVPNTDTVIKELANVVKEIENFIYDRFLAKLALNIAWDVTLTMNDFKPEKFGLKYREMGQAVENAKRRRFGNVISEGRIGEAMTAAWEGFKANEKSCEFCRVYPRQTGDERCGICRDAERLGKGLVNPHNKYLHIYEGSHGGDAELLGFTLSFQKIKGLDWIHMDKISDDKGGESPGHFQRYLARYLPKSEDGDIDTVREAPKDGNSLCRYCGDRCSLHNSQENGVFIPRRKDLVRNQLSFQCISAFTKKANGGKGADHLAVLNVDLDDTGVVFSQGLGGKFSISRYATLSRTINYFFTGWLPHIIKQEYRMCYTVFAGGDDLLVIGPWEQTLELAFTIAKKFKEFTGDNPNLTLSAGINLIRPKSPIGPAAARAEDLLQRSKRDPAKNSLTVFGTTVGWAATEKLRQLKNVLNDEYRNDKSKVEAAFLYRLLKYHELYRQTKQGDIRGWKFKAALSRDIERNIIRKSNGQIINKKLIDQLKPLYAVNDKVDEHLMNNLKIPVFWTLYKNRGGGR